VVALCSDHDIIITWGTDARGAAGYMTFHGDPPITKRVVWLRYIKSDIGYWVAMHEIGHCLGVNSEHQLNKEVNAWQWAFHNSIIPPTPQALRRILAYVSSYLPTESGLEWIADLKAEVEKVDGPPAP